MTRVTIQLRDLRNADITDPRVLVRFVNLASAHVVQVEAPFAGVPVIIDARLSPGSAYRVEVAPTLFSPALRTLMATDDELRVEAELIHRANAWLPTFTLWDSLPTSFARLTRVLTSSPTFRAG